MSAAATWTNSKQFIKPLHASVSIAAITTLWGGNVRNNIKRSHTTSKEEPRQSSTLTRKDATGAITATANTADMASDAGLIVVYVTVPTLDVGEKIANLLVEQKLAACVNILPGVTSIYMWDGKVNKDGELQLIIKSRAAILPSLTAAVKSMHPYKECEVIGMPVVGGSPSYMKWVLDNTRRDNM